MPVLVDVQTPSQYQPLVDEAALRGAVVRTVEHQGWDQESEVVLVITGDEDIRALNLEFRDIDAPTDVLSFPGSLDEAFVTPEGYSGYLGDVVISYPRAVEQAHAAGHSATRELQLLAIHGVLHLMGLDDADEAGWRRMVEIQDAILASLPAAPSSNGGVNRDREGTAIGE
ncbi:MAG TPA: rRNA maturation RNase YbeY [Anaerolineae bacterium]|nr:rRNA maturation RNase YbeY [Anaerolineae bacterium]HPL28602.1 rRNA maturation RNase YbeY [Anaerolineae bacterium]